MPSVTMSVRDLIAELLRSPDLDAPAYVLNQRTNTQHPVLTVNATAPVSVEIEISGED